MIWYGWAGCAMWSDERRVSCVCVCVCERVNECFHFLFFLFFFCFWGSQFYSRIIRNNSFSTLGVSCEALHIGALYLSLLHFIHTYFIHIRTTARLTRLAAMCMSSINGFCSTHILRHARISSIFRIFRRVEIKANISARFSLSLSFYPSLSIVLYRHTANSSSNTWYDIYTP